MRGVSRDILYMQTRNTHMCEKENKIFYLIFSPKVTATYFIGLTSFMTTQYVVEIEKAWVNGASH